MKPMLKIRRRVLKQLLVGGAIASTGCITTGEPLTDDAQLDGAPSTDAADLGGLVIDASPTPYPPIPEGCTWDCCEAVEIPRAADGACPPVDDPALSAAGSTALSCCFDACCDRVITGPYEAEDPSACAYLAEAEVTCMEGRPFYVSAMSRKAPSTPRADWI